MKPFIDEARYSEMRDFLKDSSDKYSWDIERARSDLLFYSGSQWDEELIRTFKRSKRINYKMSELPKYVQAIKSNASKSPFHNEVTSNDPKSDKAKVEELQGAVNVIEADSDYKDSMLEMLEMGIVTGGGPVCVSTEEDDGGNTRPVVEFIRDFSTVAFDPNCQKYDMSDAESGAIVSWMPKKKAKRLYGEEIAEIKDSEVNYGKQWTVQKNCVPCVSYYEKVDNGVQFTFFVGKYIVQDAVLPIDRIPIFKLSGYPVFRNNQFVTVGIVDRVREVQIGNNLAYSSMLERLNRSVKAGYIATAESLEGLEKNISKLSDGDVPLFLYKEGCTEPKPITESFQVADLTAVMAASQTMMSAVIGIPQQGVNGIQNVNNTATEALLQQQNSESNVDVFYRSLERVSKHIGEVILQILLNSPKVPYLVKQVNGPAVVTRNAKRRIDLTTLAGIVPDNIKPLIAHYYAESLDDTVGKEVSADIVANLDPNVKLVKESEDPVALHQLNQAKGMIDNLMQELQKAQQTVAQLQKENETLNISMLDNREARQLDLAKTIMQQEHDAAIKKAELEIKSAEVAAKYETEANKIRVEAAQVYTDAVNENNRIIEEAAGKTPDVVVMAPGMEGGEP